MCGGGELHCHSSDGAPQGLIGPDGADSGLRISAFPVPGKVALFMVSGSDEGNFGTQEGDTIGLEITARGTSGRLLYVANCAAVDAPLELETIFFNFTRMILQVCKLDPQQYW